MKEIKVKEENFFNFFSDDHKIADYFVDAVVLGEVKNFRYIVCKDGDCNFSFEMNNKKYVMDPEMDRYYAMKIIEFFQKTAFKYIHYEPEKLSRVIEIFKKKNFFKNCFSSSHYFDYNVETYNYEDDEKRYKGLDYDPDWDFSFSNEDDENDENVMTGFVFSWYTDPNYSPDKQKSDDEIYEIIKKNGGVRFYVDHKHYDFGGCIKLNIFTQYGLNKLVEEGLYIVRAIVTRTFFEEEEEEINEEKSQFINNLYCLP